MAPLQNIGGLIEAVFQAWTSAEIEFLVLRNYETLPDFTTNDIDVLVKPAQLRLAEKILVATAREHTFLLHNRAEFATLALYFFHPDSLQQIHFDLFTQLTWRGFEYLQVEAFLRKRIARHSFYIPAPAHEATANLLGLFIYTGKIKEKYKSSILANLAIDPATAQNLLAETYGKNNAAILVENAIDQQWNVIEEKISALRRALMIRSLLFRPLKTIGSLAKNLRRVVNRFFAPPGLMVVLLGADGCGKSTAGAAILEKLQPTFSPMKNLYLHWKPRVFSKPKSASTSTTPHGQISRGRVASCVFFAFHWLEFFLGAWKQISPALFKGGLVLIDRYYFDLLVDQKRYRLKVPQVLVRLGYLFLKKPDLILMFDAPPEVLRARKQELSLEETTRQQSAYRSIAQTFPNSKLLDATKSADAVSSDASRAILHLLSERTQRRLGN